MSRLTETAMVTTGRHVRGVAQVLLWAVPILIIQVTAVHLLLFRLGTTDHNSIWQFITVAPRWILLVYYTVLTVSDLPVHLANGGTRRAYWLGVGLGSVLLALLLSGLAVLGFPLERALLQAFTDTRPGMFWLGEPAINPVGGIFLDSLLASIVWAVCGLLLGLGYYRFGGIVGTLLLPVTLSPVFLFEAYGSGGVGFWLGGIVYASPNPLGIVAFAIGAFLLAALLTWLLVRDVPIRNRAA